MGESDELVPMERSAAVAACFAGQQTVTHPGGHAVPASAPVRNALKAFVAGVLDAAGGSGGATGAPTAGQPKQPKQPKAHKPPKGAASAPSSSEKDQSGAPAMSAPGAVGCVGGGGATAGLALELAARWGMWRRIRGAS